MIDELKLMFLASRKFENGEAIRGGALVTDGATKPIEFKCTDPIRPTTLQRTLYGGVLEEHVLVQLIGKTLVEKVAAKPLSVVLVREPLFLQLRPLVDVPILYLLRDAEAAGVPEHVDADDRQLLTTSSGSYEPLLIGAHKDYVAEREKQRAMLRDVFAHYDLMEPFERVAAALEQVHIQRDK